MPDDAMTPGFYQSRLKGRASGRPSPRDAIRGPRREQVYAEHGLMDLGAADPNQGQLFKPSAAGVPTIPQAELHRQRGIPAPLDSNKGGFMPGLHRKTEKGTRHSKVTAINALENARQRTGTSRSGAPVKEAMEDRQALYDRGKPADWYQPVSEGRNVQGEGMAHTTVANVATRTGATHAQATRAVALTSPQTAWDEGGAPGTTDYRRTNAESAESVIRAVHGLSDPSLEAVHEAAAGAPGTALRGMKMKAGEYHTFVPTHEPIRVADPSSQKVPNFEQSLHLGHVDPAVVRGAAGAFTVDKWDVAGIGGDEKLLKSDTGYAVSHMTGVRAALKNRELPPNFQARTWNALRDQSQPTSMGTNRLFVAKRSGKIVPNPTAMPPERESAFHELAGMQSRAQSRHGSSMADKYDLEF